MGTGDRYECLKALNEEEAKLQSLLQALRERQLDVPETRGVGALSSYDQHPADEGTETYEREKDIGLLMDTQQQLAQVKKARTKLVQGTYGLCDACGRAIDPERLQALPHAILCLACKAAEENELGDRHPPLEEEMLTPKFTRSYRYPRGPAYDMEDTWQDLARYGLSDSPGDVPDSIEADDSYLNADENIGIVEPTDGIIDIAGFGQTDYDEIYPDLANVNPSRHPYPADFHLPANDEEYLVEWDPNTVGLADGSLDDNLWQEIRAGFPGDPEEEMAEELTPALEEEWRREYLADRRQKPGDTGEPHKQQG